MVDSVADRLWRRVITTTDPDACWPWMGAVGSDGYGHIRDGSSVRAVHRVAYEVAFGDVLTFEDHVLHECDNTICCRPKHLRKGTALDNMEDMARKGRNRTPRPGNGITKIDADSRALLVQRLFETGNKSQVAREFGITPTRVRQIFNEETAIA